MVAQGIHGRLTASRATEIIASVIAAVIGGLFTAEGLLGYFYNASMFWEGLDHITEIASGFAVVILGVAVAVYLWWRR